jgi:hypothetical protein
LPLHLLVGTQLTLVMRTLSTCGLLVARLFATGASAGAGLAPPLTLPCEAPPALAAAALATGLRDAPSRHSETAAGIAVSLESHCPDRLWAASIAKTIPSNAGAFPVPD